MRVLILIDPPTLNLLVDDEPPAVPYSHDKNLLQFAHEALRRNLTVLIGAVGGNLAIHPYYLVRQVYPTWKQDSTPIAYSNVAPDIIVAVFPEQLNIRNAFPHAKIVAIHAAIHWIESPERFSAKYVLDLLTAIRYNVDFIITQNHRMAEILAIVYEFFAKCSLQDRIIVAPLGIVEEEQRVRVDINYVRRTMGLEDDEIAIINSGGVWRWTDMNTFLRAFGRFNEIQPSRMKLYLMGIVQSNNIDHAEYTSETEAILSRYREFIGDRIMVYRDWLAAGRLVRAFTAASDVGLNVNQPSLENWQSYRIRFLEYMTYGLPVITTRGDLLSDACGARHAFVAESGRQESYEAILESIARDPGILTEKAAAMRALSQEFDSQRTYGPAIDHIISTPRRPVEDYATWEPSIIEFTRDRIVGELRERSLQKIGALLDIIFE